jgi:alpha-glucosidase
MLGEDIMVCPMIEKGFKRNVVFPKGNWKSNKGVKIKDPENKQFDVLIDELLWFKKL